MRVAAELRVSVGLFQRARCEEVVGDEGVIAGIKVRLEFRICGNQLLLSTFCARYSVDEGETTHSMLHA